MPESCTVYVSEDTQDRGWRYHCTCGKTRFYSDEADARREGHAHQSGRTWPERDDEEWEDEL